RQLFWRGTASSGVIREVHLHEGVNASVRPFQFCGGECVDQPDAVDRVDRRSILSRLTGLLRLQLPNVVLANIEVVKLSSLLLRFLVPVLTDIVHAEPHERLDERGRVKLSDYDECGL